MIKYGLSPTGAIVEYVECTMMQARILKSEEIIELLNGAKDKPRLREIQNRLESSLKEVNKYLEGI